jgi:hypothetical protein
LVCSFEIGEGRSTRHRFLPFCPYKRDRAANFAIFFRRTSSLKKFANCGTVFRLLKQESNPMTTKTSTLSLRCSIAYAAIALALQGAAFAQTAPAQRTGVPQAIQVPPGFNAYLKASAVGTQNFVCLPSGWAFLGPQATLFVSVPWFGGEVRQQVATHYLSLNPSETATSRPTWLASLDSSAIWAKAIANSLDPDYVAAGAIPWLLLEVAGAQHGPSGGTALSQARYLQRVNTSGGVAPAGNCTAGAIQFVPYTADYIFYRADR